MPDDKLRRCIGSARFGIEPHEAPVADFPKQPSQKDGLGRMCTLHWNAYTAGLARDAKARKSTEAAPAGTAPEPAAESAQGNRKARAAAGAAPAREATTG
jgi:hypothetical protein